MVVHENVMAVVYGLGTLCLVALVHLQLSAWLFPYWIRSFYTAGGQWRTAGIVLQVLAWVGAAIIAGTGAAFILSWMPSSWGFSDEAGSFTSYADDLSWLFGMFMGSGWVAALLQGGRAHASNVYAQFRKPE